MGPEIQKPEVRHVPFATSASEFGPARNLVITYVRIPRTRCWVSVAVNDAEAIRR